MHLARSLARNVAILLGSHVATALLGLATVVMMPILLGEVGLGRYAFALSVCTVTGALMTLGTGFHIVRDVAADHSRVAEVVASNISLRGMLWVLVGAGGLPVLLLRGVPGDGIALFAVLYLATLAGVINGVLAGALYGLERMGRASVAAVVDGAVVLVAGVPLLVITHSPVAFSLAALGGALAHLAINASFVRSLHLRFPRPSLAGYRVLAVGGAPYLTLAISQGIYSQLDTVMTGALADPATVGWFAAASRLSTVIMLVPTVVVGALFPVLSRLMPTDPEAAGAALRRMLDLVVLLVLPMTFGLAAIAPRLFTFLGYPRTFQHSVPVLVVLNACWAVTAVGVVMAYAVVAGGRLRGWVAGNLALVPLLIILDLVLIPGARRLWSNGGVGAAIANLIGETAITAFAVLWLPRGMVGRANLLFTLRALVVSGAMAGLILAMGRVPLPVAIVAGALFYVVASFGLRTLTLAELRLVTRLLRRAPLDEEIRLPAGGYAQP